MEREAETATCGFRFSLTVNAFSFPRHPVLHLWRDWVDSTRLVQLCGLWDRSLVSHFRRPRLLAIADLDSFFSSSDRTSFRRASTVTFITSTAISALFQFLEVHTLKKVRPCLFSLERVGHRTSFVPFSLRRTSPIDHTSSATRS